MASGTKFPELIVAALNVSDFIRNNFILNIAVMLTALFLLEWRSGRWPRYRRLVFSVTAFSFNFTALALMATMLVFAVLAGSSLVHPR